MRHHRRRYERCAASLLLALAVSFAPAFGASTPVAVGAQYDSTHVYVTAADMDRFAAAFVATFGGTVTKPITLTVTPTASSTEFRSVVTPVGSLSVFAFSTPIPFPFGAERTGYLVTDMDAAVAAAEGDGGDVQVAPFPDPIGRDAIIQWPGGVNMQLYWHTTPPSAVPFVSIPENRVYVSPQRADAFVHAFVAFSHGTVESDYLRADGVEIGKPKTLYRRVRIESPFGKMVVIVTDGHLPYPYGREIMGYAVSDLPATLIKATAAGVAVLAGPYTSDGRTAAMVAFPGGWIAEIHAPEHLSR
jgi:predicted enzyme related to lactoylglutathione lyase